MTRFKLLCAAIAWSGAGILMTSCGGTIGRSVQPKDHKAANLNAIIGANDLVRVGPTQIDASISKAIGRMDLGCTVTHVGGGIAVSAGHCFARSKFASKRANLSCSSGSYDITWGVTYRSPGTMTSSCVEVIATEFNDQRDYAIFRVSPYPREALEVATQRPVAGQKISILSHPRRRPLEWSGYCAIEGFFPQGTRSQFRYPCDTEGGSSGAAVLNDKMQVVGIHNFYSEAIDRNGGTLVVATPLQTIMQAE